MNCSDVLLWLICLSRQIVTIVKHVPFEFYITIQKCIFLYGDMRKKAWVFMEDMPQLDGNLQIDLFLFKQLIIYFYLLIVFIPSQVTSAAVVSE